MEIISDTYVTKGDVEEFGVVENEGFKGYSNVQLCKIRFVSSSSYWKILLVAWKEILVWKLLSQSIVRNMPRT